MFYVGLVMFLYFEGLMPCNPVAKELQNLKHKVIPNKKKYFDYEMETSLFDFDYDEGEMVFLYWDS